MQMTEGEIRRDYGQAKDKRRQIGILADLNCCDRETIKRILSGESKSEPEAGRKETEIPAAGESNPVNITDILFARLDELEEQIKPLEEEYRKVKTAIDVIAGMDGRSAGKYGW